MNHKKHALGDRNFDGLTPRFKRNIYNTAKGQLRLRVLARDFDQHLPENITSVLDIGAGQGQCALATAMQRPNANWVLSDVSAEMLSMAKDHFAKAQEDGLITPQQWESIQFVQSPVQTLSEKLSQSFGLVLCHALIEWLEEPESLFEYIAPFVKPGGYLSLIFYNVHGLIYKNLLRRNIKKVLAEDFRGYRGSLTPINPLDPQVVLGWVAQAGYAVKCHSGIRVFHDYILDPDERGLFDESCFEAELAFSQKLPYRDLGRYVHLLCRKPK